MTTDRIARRGGRKQVAFFLTAFLIFAGLSADGEVRARPSGADGPRLQSPIPEGRIFVEMCPHERRHDFCEWGYRSKAPRDYDTEVYEPQASQRRRVTRDDIDTTFDMVWSPDGDRAAFSTTDDYYEDCGISLFTARSGEVTELFPIEEFVCLIPEAWSPDGEWILFAYWSYDGGNQLYKVRPDGSDLTRLTDLGCPCEFASNPNWMNNNRIIFYLNSYYAARGIYSMADDGSDRKLLVPFPFIESMRRSPDAKSIVFTGSDGRRGATPEEEVFYMSEDGDDIYAITNNEAHETDAVWSPDGTRLAVLLGSPYSCEPGGWRIRIFDLAERQWVTKVNPTAILCFPPLEWSPSGRYLAFTQEQRSGRGALAIADLGQGTIAQVTQYRTRFRLYGWRE